MGCSGCQAAQRKREQAAAERLKREEQRKAASAQPPAPARPATGAPAPNQGQGTTQTFSLQRLDGRSQVYGSRLEAEAARVRAGGGTINTGTD